MHTVTIDGILRCEVLGYRTPVTYQLQLQPRYPQAPMSAWDEVRLVSVVRLVGPSRSELIKYPIRWEHISDRKGFDRMLTEAVALLRSQGRLDPPPAPADTPPVSTTKAAGVARLVQELLP